jgi:hypothetical protein
MTCRFQTILRLWAALTFIFGLNAFGAEANSANSTEVRSYQVRIDNKPAGKYTLTLVSQGPSVDVDSSCDVDDRILFFHYRYKYRGHEKWQGSKLVELSSDSTDSGKRCRVSFIRTAKGPVLSVDGEKRPVDGELLASSYWNLPNRSTDFVAQYLEVDSGRIFAGHFKFVDNEALYIGQRKVMCKRYRISGGDDGEVWYDSDNRLVQQSSDSDGHRTLVSLQEIVYR